MLPVKIDGKTLDLAGMSTWMTDAGAFDVLSGLEASDGHLVFYEELEERASNLQGNGFVVRVALRVWRTSSRPRSGPTGPRIEGPYLNCANCGTLEPLMIRDAKPPRDSSDGELWLLLV